MSNRRPSTTRWLNRSAVLRNEQLPRDGMECRYWQQHGGLRGSGSGRPRTGVRRCGRLSPTRWRMHRNQEGLCASPARWELLCSAPAPPDLGTCPLPPCQGASTDVAPSVPWPHPPEPPEAGWVPPTPAPAGLGSGRWTGTPRHPLSAASASQPRWRKDTCEFGNRRRARAPHVSAGPEPLWKWRLPESPWQPHVP